MKLASTNLWLLWGFFSFEQMTGVFYRSSQILFWNIMQSFSLVFRRLQWVSSDIFSFCFHKLSLFWEGLTLTCSKEHSALQERLGCTHQSQEKDGFRNFSFFSDAFHFNRKAWFHIVCCGLYFVNIPVTISHMHLLPCFTMIKNGWNIITSDLVSFKK